jgi:hypothetical protein
MSEAPDAEQLARLRKLAAMADEQIDTSDMAVVEDWSLGVRGGYVRGKLAALGNPGGMQPGSPGQTPPRRPRKPTSTCSNARCRLPMWIAASPVAASTSTSAAASFSRPSSRA